MQRGLPAPLYQCLQLSGLTGHQAAVPVVAGPLSLVELVSWALFLCTERGQENAPSVPGLSSLSRVVPLRPLHQEEAGPGSEVSCFPAQLLNLLQEALLRVLELVGNTVGVTGLLAGGPAWLLRTELEEAV